MNRHKEVCDYVKHIIVCDYVKHIRTLGWRCGNPIESFLMETYEGVTLNDEDKLYYYVEDNGLRDVKEEPDFYIPTMSELSYMIHNWAKDRGILSYENRHKQMLKVMEEIGETASALAKEDTDAIKDGIGDSMVTLIILAYQSGWDPQDCLQAAWDEIKDRTGKTQSGVFIKD